MLSRHLRCSLPLASLLAMLLVSTVGCEEPVSTDDTGFVPPDPSPLLILTTDALADAAAEYASYRESTGWTVELVSTQELLAAGAEGLGAAIEARVQEMAEREPGALGPHVLFIGDANRDELDNPAYIPMARGMLGDLGDGPYGDLDGDDAPELALGRLAVNTPAEVETYLERVRDYETNYLPGAWNRTVRLFTGVGGFGEAIDGVLEYAAGLVVEELSYDFDFTVTTAIEGSEYYLPDEEWQAEYARQYNAGGILQPYVGHTLGALYLDAMQDPVRRGLVAFLSCSDGDFQDPPYPVGSLAEQLMSIDAGPMGVIAASDVSDPFGNAVLVRELSQAMLNGEAPTYGLALRDAKNRMLYQDDDLRNAIDAAAAMFMDGQEQILLSHVTMHSLVGDPTVSPRITARAITLNDDGDHLAAGQPATISGWVSGGDEPFYGTVRVTLEINRSAIQHELEEVDAAHPDVAVFLSNHALSNDKILASAEGGVANGRFSVTLDVPPTLPEADETWLKALAINAEDDAMGSMQVVIIP